MIKDSTIIHFDNSKALNFTAENSCFEYHVGIKVIVPINQFDLCGKEPTTNMDIYITQNGHLSCDSINAKSHFIGNVKLFDFVEKPISDISWAGTKWGYEYYSIFVVSEPEEIGESIDDRTN